MAVLSGFIFLVALNLRPAVSGVGPVLTSIGDDLHWSETVLGILGAMPLWAFAAVSPLVRFFTSRIGADASILLALLVLACGNAARSLGGPTIIWLGTMAVGAGIATGNVLVPVIAKRDFAQHIPLVTGVYSACITAGSAISGLTTAPMAHALGGWRAALAVWTVPPIIVAVLWAARMIYTASMLRQKTTFTKGLTQPDKAAKATLKTSAEHSQQTDPSASRQTTPLWRRSTTWWVTLFMGLQSAAFYTMTNWLPSVATAAGFDDAQAGVHLFVFQSIGILSGLIIPALMHVHNSQVCAALTSSIPMVIAGLGWIFMPQLSIAWSVIGGIGQGASLVVALTLISLRGRTADETVALSGIAQSIGYLLASVGPLAFGMLTELSGGLVAPLTLFTALAVLQCVIAIPAGQPR